MSAEITPAGLIAAWVELVTPAMVNAAWAVWREEGEAPYMARVRDYLIDGGMSDEARAAALGALHAADAEAERRNDDLMRRTIAAALAAYREPTEG